MPQQLVATPPIPLNEVDRLATLRALCLLDTPADPGFDAITAIAAKTFGVPIALISLVDERRQWFKSRVGLSARETPRDLAFCAHAINEEEPLIVLDAERDARFANNPLVRDAPHIRFYAGAPLTTRTGMSLGTLCIIGTETRAEFTPAELQILKALAELVMIRIEALHVVGFVDPVTLLPNRHRFVGDLGDWIADAQWPLERMAAVAVDVCGPEYFHQMVKALGWEYAEGFAVAARDKLIALMPSTHLYRVDATLFAFVADAPTRLGLHAMLRELASAFTTIDHRGIPHAATLSIGSVRMKREDDASEIMRSLLSACDTARAQGRDFSAYRRRDDQNQRRAFGILAALPDALIAGDQLSLVYQPRIELVGGRCVGVEALLRWKHPVFGDVPPCDVIPLAEKTALIHRVTQWVLDTGFSQAAAWQRAGHTFRVAVNVSAVDLDRPEFADQFVALIARTKVDPRLVEIEFTESAMSLDADRLEKCLQRIRALGVHVAIDDFGAGYSNLNYLKRIPSNALKIDRSFIDTLLTNPKDGAIVPSIIQLGHGMGQRVVAEGIETREVLDRLIELGCDEGQGYWIARPMSVGNFEAWLAARRPVKSRPRPVAVEMAVVAR